MTGRFSFLGVLVVLCALSVPQTLADEVCAYPLTWTADYWIHQTPTDPESPVTFKIHLSLASAEGDCTAIGWSVTEIEIRQVDPNAGPDTVWIQENPTVLTEDGLWWASHANVSDPQPAEFALLPHLQGTAIAQNPEGADLQFDVAGTTYALTPPYEVTAGMTYALTPVGESSPIADGEDEPTQGDPPIEG